MKYSLLILLLLPLIVSSCNEDLLFPDGPTKAKGHVINERTAVKVAGVSVLLYECKKGWLGGASCEILDSTITNAEGFYEFYFKDKKNTNFGVGIAPYPKNSLFVKGKEYKNYEDQDYIYVIKEGDTNVFDYKVIPFSKLKLNVQIIDTAITRLRIQNSFGTTRYLGNEGEIGNYYTRVKAPMDTIIYLDVLPGERNTLKAFIGLGITGSEVEEKEVVPNDQQSLEMTWKF